MEFCNNIAILLATYNGEKYLCEQLDSIISQTYTDWHLYIHDDGSKDNTLDIIRQYIAKYPEKITLLDYPSTGGACKNFFSMLEAVDSPFYMFCDQDDIWINKKIEIEFMEMQKYNFQDTPIIIATDLYVVDQNKVLLQNSLWKTMGIYPSLIHTFNEVAGCSLVTGCTMLFNKKLKEQMPSPTSNATMHDAWLCCSVLKLGGVLRCLPIQTIYYRQHGNNTLGAHNVSSMTLLYRIKTLKRSWNINKGHYLMLKDMDYGSPLKYLYYKWVYYSRIKKSRK